MKKFNILLVHESLQQFKSFKFIVLFVLSFTLSLSVGYLRIENYKERYNTYMVESQLASEKLKQAQVYSELEVAVFIPPNPLSIFSKGIDDKIGNKIIISATHYPGILSTSQKSNPFLKLFSEIDIVGIVKLFSIFIILMTAGVIAGEREEQTLKIIFVNNVSRIEYFLSKYISISIVAFSSVLVIMFVPAVMILFNTQIAPGEGFIMGVVSLLIVSFLYISIFILLSLLLSSKYHSSSQAILTTLFIWLGLTFIYPQITSSLASRINKTPSKISLEAEIKQIDIDQLRDNFDFILRNRDFRPVSANSFSGFVPDNGRSSLLSVASKIDLTQKYYFEYNKKLLDFEINNLWKRHNNVQSLENAYRNSLLKQASLFESLNFIIPDVLYKKITEIIAQTSKKQREEDFLNAALNYRVLIFDYIKSKNGFGYSFFTQMPEEEMIDDYYAYTEDQRQRSLNMTNLRTDDIPVFTLNNKRNLPREIITLIVLNLVLSIAGIVTFYRSNIL